MIFDTHAHYDDKQFDQDREELLASMKDNGIGTIVDVGSNMETSTWIVEAVTRYPMMYGAVGVHPSDTAELKESDIDTLKKYAAMDRILAIGEIGLDYYWDEPERSIQKKWFEAQIELARDVKLPIIIHSRDAAKDTYDIMKALHAEEIGGVVHCFSYSKEMARQFLDMGFYIGIGGVVTFKNAKTLKEVAAYTPLDRIVLETDCPYLSPEPNRGKRNSSLNLNYVAEALSQIKGINKEELIAVTEENARQLYRMKEVLRVKLGNPKNTIEVIQKYDFDFQKKFGQNFLIDERVLEKIISAAEVNKDDFVLEIGPGIGTMTQYLAENAREVMAVEIDKNLIPILSDTLSAYDNVSILNADILKVDIAKIVEEKNGGKPVKVVANLPYYITTPIIMGLFESHVPIDSITVMVQKEVADRMQSGPGTKDYGALSLAVQYYAEPYVVANVPPNCFMPRPKVGSAVIRLTKYKDALIKVTNEKLLFQLIRASFNQRRKTLQNGIKNFGGLNFSKEQVAQALEEMELPASVRGEALTLEQFAQLSNILDR